MGYQYVITVQHGLRSLYRRSLTWSDRLAAKVYCDHAWGTSRIQLHGGTLQIEVPTQSVGHDGDWYTCRRSHWCVIWIFWDRPMIIAFHRANKHACFSPSNATEWDPGWACQNTLEKVCSKIRQTVTYRFLVHDKMFPTACVAVDPSPMPLWRI